MNACYEAVIILRDNDGTTREERVSLTALNETDAKLQMQINQEFAEKRYGKANVISVTLVKKIQL